jgi:hypothetical protein
MVQASKNLLKFAKSNRKKSSKIRNTSSVCDMISNLKWKSLAEGRKDSGLVVLYKFSYEEVAFQKTDRLIPPLRQSRTMHSLAYQIRYYTIM